MRPDWWPVSKNHFTEVERAEAQREKDWDIFCDALADEEREHMLERDMLWDAHLDTIALEQWENRNR